MTTALSQLSKYHKSALQLQLLQSKHRALKGASSTLGPSAGFSCARYATAIPKYSDPHGCQPPADISSGSILTANLRHTQKHPAKQLQSALQPMEHRRNYFDLKEINPNGHKQDWIKY